MDFSRHFYIVDCGILRCPNCNGDVRRDAGSGTYEECSHCDEGVVMEDDYLLVLVNMDDSSVANWRLV